VLEKLVAPEEPPLLKYNEKKLSLNEIYPSKHISIQPSHRIVVEDEESE